MSWYLDEAYQSLISGKAFNFAKTNFSVLVFGLNVETISSCAKQAVAINKKKIKIKGFTAG